MSAATRDLPQMPTTVMPHLALLSRDYTLPPFTDPNVMVAFQSALKIVVQILKVNQPGGYAHGGDDLLVWFRHLGFTADAAFVQAFAPYREDGVLRARLWRIYTLCWAAKSCLDIDGDFLDIGCYDGKTVDVMRRYCDFAASTKTWRLYDMFDHHPTEASKQHHGPQLFDQVRGMFSDEPRIKVVKGLIPDTMRQDMPERVAFAQIDLNAPEAELAALEAIYDRVTIGGIIVLDDYGFDRYRSSYAVEKRFFESRGAIVYECPTGQGVAIKRK